MKRSVLIVILALFAPAAPSLAAPSPGASGREFSIDLWDWTAPCRDLATFKTWAADMKSIGVTRIEISAPWNLLEPRPGSYDLSFITDRLAVARAHGMGMRIRINSFYHGATPGWYVDEVGGDRWQDIQGNPPQGTPWPVSFTDERFWRHFGPLCTRIAAAVKGQDCYLNPFIGVHAELKWSDWWSYAPSTLAAWRRAVGDRPHWLSDVAGDAPLPDKPPVPPPTTGTPDASPVSRGWIAFREQAWRDAIARFTTFARAGDPDAKLSTPLGESFRRQSAAMSNLDYFGLAGGGLSRGPSQIVHSYDFFWHPKDDPWHAAAAVAAFRGITGIEDIAFEFDGPNLIEQLGYDRERLIRIAEAAIGQGASLKAANYSYFNLPSSYPLLVDLGGLAASAARFEPAPREKTVLLFLSKWANYCYRERTEWLHDAQFGAWRMLTQRGLAVRIICEDNLDEDLSTYRGLYVAFSPPQLLPTSRRAQLESLQERLASIVELTDIPPTPPTREAGTLAYRWLQGDRAAADAELTRLLGRYR